MNYTILSVLLTIGILIGQASADEATQPAHKLSEWKLGETLFGEKVSPAALDGKVVVLEYWDAKCQSCLSSISKLTVIDQKLRNKGLRVIGAEAYQSGKGKIGEVVKSKNVEFSITDGVKGPLSISGLPHAVVFGVDGRVLFSGHPNDEKFEKTVRKALSGVKDVERVAAKGVTPPLIAERTWRNREGKPLLASVSGVEGSKVIFKKQDGSEVPYALEKLSDEDQKLIKARLGKRTSE